MFITLLHLTCNALGRLVALDEGDGLLSFKTIFLPAAREYEGTNTPTIIAVALCGGVLEFLIRHTIVRVLGTCLVVASIHGNQQYASDTEAPRRHDKATSPASVFSLLRKTKLLRARVRRSIAYAFLYSIASGLCSALVSSLSESYLWLASAEIATAVLLERIHFRWTRSIVGHAPHTANSYPWRELLLPSVVYAVACKIVADLPAAVGDWFVAEGIPAREMVATRDIAVLASAFILRFFLLYPTWSTLICFETRRTSRPTDTSSNQSHSYGHTLKLCYKKVLLRLAGLHLQAAGIMVGIEFGTYIIFHFLLHTPTSPASA